jgi:hypothetical protein
MRYCVDPGVLNVVVGICTGTEMDGQQSNVNALSSLQMLSLSTSLLDMDENDASSKFLNRHFRSSRVILFENFRRKTCLRTFSPVVRDRFETIVSARGNKSVQQCPLFSTVVLEAS